MLEHIHDSQLLVTLAGKPPGGHGSLNWAWRVLAPPTLWSSCLCFLNRQGVKRLHSKTPATQTVPEVMPPHQGGLKVSDVMSPVAAFLHKADFVKCSIPEMRKVSEESILCSFGF